MRILIVTPTPTHPPTEGSSRRVLSLAEALMGLGHEMHALYLPARDFPAPDLPAMRRAWGRRLHVAERVEPLYWEPRLRRVLRRLDPRQMWFPPRDVAAPETAFDIRIPPSWRRRTRALHERLGFDAVIVEYVFASSILCALPAGVRRVLDTLDVFTDRNARMAALGDTIPWLEATAQDEGTALDRADVAIAIQEDEATELRALSRSTVVTVSHLVEPAARPAPEPDGPPSLLLLGGQHSLNVQGLRWLCAEVWPRLRRALPGIVLRVAGRLGEWSPSGVPGLERLGVLADVAQGYARAHVVVNPVLAGTGLSVKTIEALAHGKALVSTPAGARGLRRADEAVVVASGAADVADAILELLRDPVRRHRQAWAAWHFATEWRRAQLDALTGVLERPLQAGGPAH